MPTGTLTLRQLCPMRSSKSKRTVSSESIASADTEGQIDEPEVIVRDTPKRLVPTEESIGVTSSVLAEGEGEAAKNLEEWQELRIAGLSRLIVSPERSKEIQQRQPYADIGRPFYKGGQGSENGWSSPRIRIDRQIHKSWESKLSKFGLSLQQQKLQNTQDVVVPLRITAQLIQAPADRHLWAQSYEGNARDVLTLQRQIASAIAEQIRIKLTPQQQTVLKTARFVNPEAYEDYMRGHYVTQTGAIDGYERSIVYFNQAIKKDAQNALAYAGLADSYIELGHMVRMPPEQAFPTARKAALQALQLDDSLAEAHQALANVKFLYDWDFPGADREFRRALDLNPNSVSARADYADYLIAMGRFDESIAERRRNLQMDPLAQRPIWALSTGYYWAHRYDEAIAEARQAIEMDPNHWSGHLDLGLALEQKHQFPAAISELQKAIEVSNDKIWVSFIAHDMALSGDKAGAEKILADLQQLSKRTYVSPWLLAMIYPDLGDKEKAFTWLEKCYERREHDLVFSKVWPMFDGLRSDPRYSDLMRRIGLPQ
jgi:tetratricopeptide (TPR) repeat protein